MKSKILSMIFVMIFAVTFYGCAVNRATAIVDPSADLTGIKSIYVTKSATDERGVNDLIANKLKNKGYLVDTGSIVPTNVDAVVTYRDKWVWDITMYMLELTIMIREPKTDFPLASGNSFHTSLTRKSPEEMVDEVINNIFKGGTKDGQK